MTLSGIHIDGVNSFDLSGDGVVQSVVSAAIESIVRRGPSHDDWRGGTHALVIQSTESSFVRLRYCMSTAGSSHYRIDVSDGASRKVRRPTVNP